MDVDLANTLESLGYIGMLVSILLENGVLLLFFLPSDSLLFTAGFLSAQGIFDIRLTILFCFIGSVLGYMMGYSVGHKAGPMLFKEQNQNYLTLQHLEKSKEFYNKYASWALVLARFFPVRAFVSSMAGASGMNYRVFMFYNILGGAIWSVSLTLGGYYFGKLFTPESLDTFFLAMFAVFILGAAFFPALITFYRSRMNKKNAKRPPQE
jgi:membrane-associated protein